jgi:hypothetical protein
MEDNTVFTALEGHQVCVTGKSTSLLEALGRLGAEGIDLVLMSSEFTEEELALFTLDARRRGFSGLVVHVASAMVGLRDPILGTNLERENGRVASVGAEHRSCR